jgi:hypothetical protein
MNSLNIAVNFRADIVLEDPDDEPSLINIRAAVQAAVEKAMTEAIELIPTFNPRARQFTIEVYDSKVTLK